MRAEKKRARQQQNLAALLGITAPESSGWDEKPHAASREAEAVLLYTEERGKGFVEKDCEECSGKFAVNSFNVRYCSDQCRRKALKARGFNWDPGKPYTRRWEAFWPGGQVKYPLVLGVNALEVAKEVLATTAEINETPTGQGAAELVTGGEITSSGSTVDRHQATVTDTCPVGEHTFEEGCEFYFDLENIG